MEPNDICFTEKYVSTNLWSTQLFFSKFLPMASPGCLFIGRYFSVEHISFNSIFDAEFDFDVEIFFSVLFLVKIIESECQNR
jgi:hypothetical protein